MDHVLGGDKANLNKGQGNVIKWIILFDYSAHTF